MVIIILVGFGYMQRCSQQYIKKNLIIYLVNEILISVFSISQGCLISYFTDGEGDDLNRI